MMGFRWLGYLFLAMVAAGVWAGDAPWVLVDTQKQVLSVMQDGRELFRFDRIAIGRGGAASLRKKGDGTTPLGSYRVAWINDDSPFHRFFGFDFPSRADAERARSAGVLSEEDYGRIHRALEKGRLPPQDTPLGGRLGIHGIGGGSRKVHQDFNWTQGCIALTNEQVDRLTGWMDVGTRVVVR